MIPLVVIITKLDECQYMARGIIEDVTVFNNFTFDSLQQLTTFVADMYEVYDVSNVNVLWAGGNQPC